MLALKEAGFKKLVKHIFFTFALIVFQLCIFSPLRKIFLIILGAKIGKNTYIQKIRFINLYRGNFKNLVIGSNCFLGEDTLLDLADRIIMGDNVTIAARCSIITHINVGFSTHKLKEQFPGQSRKVVLENHIFVGTGCIILMGCTIKNNAFIAAGSVVNRDVPPDTLAGGVPAKKIKKLKN